MVVVATYFLTSLLSLPHVIQIIKFFCHLCHKLKVKKKTAREYPFGSFRYAFRVWKMSLGTTDGRLKNVKTIVIGLNKV
jgi:hypothetical protein